MIQMPTKYRKFFHSDRPVVAGMIKALYAEDPSGWPMTDAKIEATFKSLAKRPELGCIMVLEEGSGIIGYAILINYLSNEYGGNVLHIDELYVVPERRGQGVGTDFIRHLIGTRFNDAVAIQLEVHQGNKRARALYERIGFRPSASTQMVFEIVRQRPQTAVP